MISSALFTSKRRDWPTPQRLFDRLHEEFRFTLDACADRDNAKTPLFFDAAADGLVQPWTGTVWCNPPYGPDIGQWLRRAATCAADVVVVLVPARTDTDWFHRWAMRAAECRLIRRRIRFGSGARSAPFPSCLLVFRRGVGGPPRLSTYWSYA